MVQNIHKRMIYKDFQSPLVESPIELEFFSYVTLERLKAAQMQVRTFGLIGSPIYSVSTPLKSPRSKMWGEGRDANNLDRSMLKVYTIIFTAGPNNDEVLVSVINALGSLFSTLTKGFPHLTSPNQKCQPTPGLYSHRASTLP